MGPVLALFQSSHNAEQVFIDFENATPSEQEKELFDTVRAVLEKSPNILEKLNGYIGCDDQIKQAISKPSAETEEAAWNALLPHVDILLEFYNYGQELEGVFPKLLLVLCSNSGSAEDTKKSLANQQALAKLFGDIFDFTLKFDDSKLINPAIQNDFSYYRRTLNRMKVSSKARGAAEADTNIKIRDDLANKISLFFAQPTPMMKILSETTVKFFQKETAVAKNSVTNVISSIANICNEMMINNKFSKLETKMFCLRVMTGAIILYDHISDNGAFNKKSAINVKSCLQTLKGFTESSTEGLINTLKYTSIHLNDDDTPASIRTLVG